MIKKISAIAIFVLFFSGCSILKGASKEVAVSVENPDGNIERVSAYIVNEKSPVDFIDFKINDNNAGIDITRWYVIVFQY